MDRILTLVALGSFHAISLVLIASVVIYGFFTEWRTEEVSRHTMHYMFTFAVAWSYTSLVFFFPFLPANLWVVLAIYVGILYNVSRRLYLIIKYRFIVQKGKIDAS